MRATNYYLRPTLAALILLSKLSGWTGETPVLRCVKDSHSTSKNLRSMAKRRTRRLRMV